MPFFHKSEKNISKVKDKVNKKSKKVGDSEELNEVINEQNTLENETETPEEKLHSEADLKIEALEKQIAELKDNHVRLMAEFDNFRKRTRKEKDDLRQYGGENVLKSLLPVIDNFERTIGVLEKSDNLEAIQKGVKMISQSFGQILEKQGLKPIESIGATFDPNFHEAVTTIPAQDESQKDIVVDEAEKGYLLHDRVIRFSKVIVGE